MPFAEFSNRDSLPWQVGRHTECARFYARPFRPLNDAGIACSDCIELISGSFRIDFHCCRKFGRPQFQSTN